MQIPHDDLQVGTVVWYRYSETKSVQGPYRVKNIIGRFDGRHVQLANDRETIHLPLDDDDVFGLLLFYDAEPKL